MKFIVLPLVFGGLMLMSSVLRGAFVAAHWENLRDETIGSLALSFAVGLRFDAAVVGYVFVLLTPLYVAARLAPRVRWCFQAGVLVATTSIAALWLADIQYFHDAGKHFTYEAFAFLNRDLIPIVASAFELHPWFSSASLLACVATTLAMAVVVRRGSRGGSDGASRRAVLVRCAWFAVFLALAIRGGVQRTALQIGDSFITGRPYLNAVALNPMFSALSTMLVRLERPEVVDEAAIMPRLQDRLEFGPESLGGGRYPLLRSSEGVPGGNRKNVVLFFLESWTGKDVGALGSRLGATPFFDRLAGQGLLFTNAFATGIRSPEGIFSTLCSFPNQPLIPIMSRPVARQTRWRSLSHILAENGYHNVFVHGSDLRFDDLEEYVRAMDFHTVVDSRDFPVEEYDHVAWGVNDEVVMRRADALFAGQIDQPFFGVIYTLNTHPPFTVPAGFPLVAPQVTASDRYLNALRYSDRSLETFFSVAQTRDYFRNTIFILIADHTRTRDTFTFADQHRIPFLIYSPDGHPSGVNTVVGSQVDVLPTVLALLNLETMHASWGRNLLALAPDDGFAVSVTGTDVKWQDSRYLLVDNRTDSGDLFLCDVAHDPACALNVWEQQRNRGERLKAVVRAYVDLSQALLFGDRVFPPHTSARDVRDRRPSVSEP